MQTIEDRKKQAQMEVESALNKRKIAWKAWEEAGEELAKARAKMEEALKEEQVQKRKDERVRFR